MDSAVHEVSPGTDAAETQLDLAVDAVLETVPRAMHRIRDEMRKAAEPGLTVPQLRTMLFVRRHPGSSLSAVADHLGIGLTSASAMVDRLVRGGLLSRDVAPDERRRMMLALTQAGVDRTRMASAAARRGLADALADLGADELEAIDAGMRLLRHALIDAGGIGAAVR